MVILSATITKVPYVLSVMNKRLIENSEDRVITLGNLGKIVYFRRHLSRNEGILILS